MAENKAKLLEEQKKHIQKIKRENVTSNELTDRKNKMLKFLQNNPYINLTDYAGINHCYRATEDMKLFVKDGIVIKMGYRTHRVYSLPPKEEEE